VFFQLGSGRPPCSVPRVLHVVLVEPEIPPNTGNIARLCLAAGARLHLVEPLGFSLDEKALRRAGMDYWEQCDVKTWTSLDALRQAAEEGARFFYFTTKTRRVYWEAAFAEGDHLVFGRESRGLPESLLEAHAGSCLTIPQQPSARSLNLATAAGIALYEAIRQIRTR
jgi:tRNA (cytidine/uridine-2'-O-)-methyltransferase